LTAPASGRCFPIVRFFHFEDTCCLIITLLCVFWVSLQRIESYDLWFHLASGKWIIANRHVPRLDPFSFTAPGPWQDHEWLSQIVLFSLFRTGGLFGLIVCKSAILAATFGLLFYLVNRELRVATCSLLLVTLGVIASWGSLDVRPEMFSLFLFTVIVFLGQEARKTRGASRALLLMPLLMILWANLHGGFIAGLIVVGSGLATEWARKLAGREDCWQKAQLARASASWFCSIATSLINPYTYRALTYPLEYLWGKHHYATTRVTEWLPPELSRLPGLAFLVICLLTVLVIGGKRRVVSWDSLVVMIIFGVSGALHRRHIPFFVFVSLPALATLMSETDPITKLSRTTSASSGRLIAGLIQVALVSAAIWKSDMRAGLLASPYRTDLYPVSAAQFLLKNPLPPHLFSLYRHGGFFIWRLFPRYRVFVDGRADVYGEKLLREYAAIIHVEPGWQKILASHGTSLAVLPREEAVAQAMERSSRWHRIYRDATTDVYLRQCAESAAALSRWRNDELQYPEDADAFFYRGLSCAERGMFARAAQHWKKCLSLDPHYADAYANLGTVEARRGRLQVAISLWQRAIQISDYADPQVYRNIGKALDKQGKHGEARYWYREASRIETQLPKRSRAVR